MLFCPVEELLVSRDNQWFNFKSQVELDGIREAFTDNPVGLEQQVDAEKNYCNKSLQSVQPLSSAVEASWGELASCAQQCYNSHQHPDA